MASDACGGLRNYRKYSPLVTRYSPLNSIFAPTMQLVIDIGNTKIKIAVFNGDEALEYFALPKLAYKKFEDIFKKYPKLNRCIICSVSEDIAALKGLLEQHLKITVFNHNTPLPITNKYDTPKTLGYDRLAGAVGAFDLNKGKNVLVIDSGTCITYNFITAKGEYLGGAISPGLDMRFSALNHFTAKLPLVEYEEGGKLIGTDTKYSILSGVINGMAFEMDGFIDAYAAKYKGLQVILTGGNAVRFEHALKNRIFAHPNLVLWGLKTIHNYNEK